jgi:hypothetical protein
VSAAGACVHCRVPYLTIIALRLASARGAPRGVQGAQLSTANYRMTHSEQVIPERVCDGALSWLRCARCGGRTTERKR